MPFITSPTICFSISLRKLSWFNFIFCSGDRVLFEISSKVILKDFNTFKKSMDLSFSSNASATFGFFLSKAIAYFDLCILSIKYTKLTLEKYSSNLFSSGSEYVVHHLVLAPYFNDAAIESGSTIIIFSLSTSILASLVLILFSTSLPDFVSNADVKSFNEAYLNISLTCNLDCCLVKRSKMFLICSSDTSFPYLTLNASKFLAVAAISYSFI